MKCVRLGIAQVREWVSGTLGYARTPSVDREAGAYLVASDSGRPELQTPVNIGVEHHSSSEARHRSELSSR